MPASVFSSNCVRFYRHFCFKSYRKCLCNVGFYSTNSNTPESHADSLSAANHRTEVVERTKLKTNVPFAKNLFLGKFDYNLLVFPELPTTEEFDELNQMIGPLERFFTEEVDSQAIDIAAKIPSEVLQQLKDFGLFGLEIPPEYGGLGLNATKYARVAEVTALDGSISVTLAGHQTIGLKGLLKFGTETQKQKYLPRLATGELTAAFCLTEPSSGSDAASIRTRATLSEDGTCYVLNGSKIWITNGGIADVFTVFAKTEVRSPITGKMEDKVTAFFVERAFGGVSSGAPEDKLGIRGSNTCEVFFDNTPVPLENVIGEVGGGFKVAMTILNSGRFSMGSSCAGGLKRLIGIVSEHVTSRTQFGKHLSEFEIIKEKMARLSMATYAMESMSYLTAGVIDQYRDPDMAVEAAMVKVYSSERTNLCVSECLQMLGGLGYMKSFPYERALRDARILPIFEGTNEILRLFIALTGVQHAGAELQDMVRKLKNPLNNPGFVFKQMISRFRQDFHNPKLSLRLSEHVHPLLALTADHFEKRVHKFKMVVEKTLSMYGKDVVDEQLALARLADISIELYAMTSVLARASRSLSIGLRDSEHEFLLAQSIVFDSCKKVDALASELNSDKVENNDEVLGKLANAVFKHNKYVAEHPLTRNW